MVCLNFEKAAKAELLMEAYDGGFWEIWNCRLLYTYSIITIRWSISYHHPSPEMALHLFRFWYHVNDKMKLPFAGTSSGLRKSLIMPTVSSWTTIMATPQLASFKVPAIDNEPMVSWAVFFFFASRLKLTFFRNLMHRALQNVMLWLLLSPKWNKSSHLRCLVL